MSRPFGGGRGGAATPYRHGAALPDPFRCARLLTGLLLLCLAPAAVAAATVTVLPLGDSITHGTDAYPSYRPLLYHDLRGLGYDVDFVGSSHTPALAPGLDPDNEGHPNYTAADVRAALPGWLAAYPPPQVALVHLGTNDAIYWVPRDRTIADLTAIVGQLRARNPDVTVLVARIIPTSVASTNARIEALNAAIGGFAGLSTARSPIVVVDQYAGYDAVADNQRGGVHPLTSGELKMAARWKASLVPVLDRIGAGGERTYGPHAIPGRIEAEDYDAGGFVDTTVGNAGNAYRSDDVDIEYAAREESYAVGWIRTSESLSYTANVTSGGPCRLSARVSSPYDGRQIEVTADGTTVAVVPVPNTGSFDAYTTVTVGAAFESGTRRLTLTFTGDGQNLNWIEVSPDGPVATSTVPPLPPADVAELGNSTFEPTLITWTWTDPDDPLFANVTVLLDGAPAATVERGVQAFTATGLSPDSEHTVSTRTRNTPGVVSATWANHTARTAPGTATPTATATPAPPSTPSGPQAPYPSARTLPAVVEAEHFDAGGEGVAYHDVDPWNIGGDGSRAGEGVDIETDGGVTDVCYVRAGECLEYSVDSGAAGSYGLTLRVANPDAVAKAVKVYLDGVPVGEVLVGCTGSWTLYRDFTGSAPLTIPTGRHVVTLAFEGVERVNLDHLSLGAASPTGTPTPTVTATETPAPTANVTPTADSTPTAGVTTTVTPTATETETVTPTPIVTATGPTPDATPTAEAVPPVTGTPPPVPVPAAAGAPLDPDGDGRYEDVNGNGRADFADVTLLFEALAWCAEHEPAGVFDFNTNGRIDFADVVALFNGL